MSTNDEFVNAAKFLEPCIGSVSCGCDLDEELARVLYLKCKDYIEGYRRGSLFY